MNRILTCFLLFLGLLAGCVKNFEKPSWEIEALTPILHTSLSIDDIVKDSILTSGEGDSLFIVFSQDLTPVTMDTLLTLEVKPYIKHIKLDSIRLNDQQISESINLGEVLTEAGLSGLIKDGTSTIIPGIPGIEVGPFEVDGSQYFQSINLKNGYMELEVQNGFPVDIKNISYAIINTASQDTVHTGAFPDLPAGASDKDSVSLIGKTIEGLLDIQLTADVIGTGFSSVLIDYADAIETTIRIKDMQIYSAYAIFPAQNIINHKEVVPLEDMEDKELTLAKFYDGLLRISIVSTIEEESYFTYYIPNATKDGEPFLENMTGPPAPPGGTQTLEFNYRFEGYDFDLTGESGDTINAFYNEIIGRIDSTGNLVYLTLEDSVEVRVEVLEMNPAAAYGYMGQNVFSVGPDSIKVDALNNFRFENLSVKGAKLSFRVENFVGMDGEIDLKNIKAVNTTKNEEINMQLDNLDLPFTINRAQDGTEISPAVHVFTIDDQNSNPSEIISLFPDKIVYAIDITTNPGGNDGSYKDFIYADKTINSFLDIEIPMNIKAGGLTLTDTVDLFEEPVSELEGIKQGTLKFIIENGFPLESDIKIRFFDSENKLVDEFSKNKAIFAASVDQNNIAVNPQTSVVEYFVEEGLLQQILASKYAEITAVLRTAPADKHLQIFSTYAMKVNVVGDFVYEMNNFEIE